MHQLCCLYQSVTDSRIRGPTGLHFKDGMCLAMFLAVSNINLSSPTVNEILGLCLPDERQSTHTDKYLPIYHHLYQWYCQYHYLTNIGHCQVLSELNNQKTFQFRSLGRSQALHCHPFPHGSMAYHGLPIGLKIDRVVFPHPWFLDVFFGWVVLKKSIEPCRNPWFL